MEPYNRTNVTTIINGAVQLNSGTRATGVAAQTYQNTIISQLTTLLGDLPSQFHQVMLCLPPAGITYGGIPNWSAYGFAGHWLTAFSNDQ